jgi:hypothetical protein
LFLSIEMERFPKGGFMGRWLLFVSSGPDYKLPRCDRADQDAEQRLLAGMGRLKAVAGEVKVGDQAWGEYAAWVKRLTVSERLASFRSRFENAALKVTLIYEVSQGGMTVGVDTMRLATGLVDWLAGRAETFSRRQARVRPSAEEHGQGAAGFVGPRRADLEYRLRPAPSRISRAAPVASTAAGPASPSYFLSGSFPGSLPRLLPHGVLHLEEDPHGLDFLGGKECATP